ncbi:MAG: site-specific DNA-methyltransferase [Candidatus Pacebacteria bacterium]|nr:site-specific DNA-methyltransferase [Candidatus Paceibacterota bacterium]
MQNLLDNLKTLFQKDERLVSEGELLKNKIIELALKLDKELIELLLSDEQMRDVFFKQVGKATIFDKDKFIKFVSNKQFLPDSYTAFKNKIGLVDEKDEFISEKKDVVLSWPYKDCVLEGGMAKEDQKRDEIFWNETLAPDEISRLLDPKVFTNAKRIDKNGEHKFDKFKTDENGNIKDNLIIKGNNLLALHPLKKRFAGKVKLIYIDPPYNTGNDEFKYNDAFNHSSWLTFMRNRLEVTKDLLKNDGVIFISCDDNEQAYLKVLCDEIFRRENFVQNFMWLHGKGKKDRWSRTLQQYILCYAKNKNNLEPWSIINYANYEFSNSDNDPRGPWFSGSISFSEKRSNKQHPNYFEIKSPSGIVWKRQWQRTKEEMEELLKQKKIFFGFSPKYDAVPRIKIFSEDTEELIPPNIIDNIETTRGAQKELDAMFDKKVFDYPKPVSLMKHLIKLGSDKNAIIVDFMAGTGTTAQAVLELNKEDGGNRKFILCEQLDYTNIVTVPRVQKVIKKLGDGDFAYLELAKWNENFVEKIQKTKTKEKLAKLWETMKEKARLSYKVDIAAFDEHAKDFEDLSIEDQKRFLLECLDKNHLYINYSEIDDEEYGVSEEDKEINKEFYIE